MKKNGFKALFSAFEHFLSGRFWVAKTVIIATFLSFFFQFPNYTALSKSICNPPLMGYFYDEINISRVPFKQVEYKKDSHNEKLTFRLTLPLLIRLLHLSPKAIVVLFNFLSLLILYFSAKTIFSITGDRLSAFFFTVSIGNIYYGCSGFIDSLCLADVLPYFLIILALSCRKPWLIYLSIFVATWADERVLLASSLILLFYQTDDDGEIGSITSIFSVNKFSIAIVSSWVTYFATRLLIIHIAHFTNRLGAVGLDIIYLNRYSISISLWSAFEGFWLIIILMFLVLLVERKYFYFGVLSLVFIPICILSLMVFDTTKSISYAFPVIFIGIKYLKNKLDPNEVRIIMVCISIICIVSTTNNYLGSNTFTSPIYQEMISHFFKLSVGK